MNEIKNNELIEIKPLADIGVIEESLCRMGIGNKKKKILYPTCYLYRNYESYYIVHFKSMFTLTRANGYNNISEKDIERRNSIIFCLQHWGLIDVVEKKDIIPHNEFVFVISYKEKTEWTITHKFNVAGTEVLK